ncbi:MAG TPA: heavy metal sensor histidine kinase [Noviherbaspirillum sp.]
MKRISLTNRLTILFVLASATMLLGLGLVISSLVESHFEELDREALTGKVELAKTALSKVGTQADLNKLPQQLGTALIGHSGLAIAVRWPDASTLLTASGEQFPRTALERATDRGTAQPTRYMEENGKPLLRMTVAVPIGLAGAPPALVDAALDISHHEHFISTFATTLWSTVIFAAIVSGILGRFAVRQGLAPLRAIRSAALDITANKLHQRLATASVPVELQELAAALNTMLGRLEESFQRLSDFSSDLAHELRTPVSNMLTQSQVTLSKARSAEEYREILYSNAEEFNRLSRMISDMLFLAKADHGLVSPFNDKVDLHHEVKDLFSFFDVLADSKNISLRVEGEGKVRGDRMLLRRAISNVLSNAIRHTHDGGHVLVKIYPLDSRRLTVRIENTGDTIAQEHIPRLFDRFYRVDASRHDSAEGAGLGLAITKSIATLHGGTIAVESRDGTTCFALCLPSN